MMRTAGLTMNDVWADRVLRERGVEIDRYEAISAEIGVLVESVELKHHSQEQKYRPYLHMSGELRSVTPSDPLPYGISQITYSPGQGEKVDAFYEFDDHQLVALAGKGYFNSAFVVPEQITGIEWELPATADVLVLAPSGLDADVPVVFIHVRDIASLDIDLESCGYDLTDYFADHSKDGITRAEAVVDERGLRARSDAINSLFGDDELDLVGQAKQDNTTEPQQAVVGNIEAGLQQVQAEIDAERERYQIQRALTAGTPENLYHERVAAILADSQDRDPGRRPGHAAHAEPNSEPDAELENDEQELERQDQQAQRRPPTFSERKQAVAQRAADLDLDEDPDHGLGS